MRGMAKRAVADATGERRAEKAADVMRDVRQADIAFGDRHPRLEREHFPGSAGIAGEMHRRAMFGERAGAAVRRSEEHTSELQSLMRISYAVFCLKKKKKKPHKQT